MLHTNEGTKIHLFQDASDISFDPQFSYHANTLDHIASHLERFVKQHNQMLHIDDLELLRSVITNAQYMKSIMIDIDKIKDMTNPEQYDFREEMSEINKIMQSILSAPLDLSSISIIKMLDVNTYLKESIARHHSRQEPRGGFFSKWFMGR